MHPIIDPKLLERLRVGPLAPYLDLYPARIEGDGFLPSSAELLQAGGRPGGHCNLARARVVETTQIYLNADLTLKEQGLQKAMPIEGKALRF
jgi:hypothetical protein